MEFIFNFKYEFYTCRFSFNNNFLSKVDYSCRCRTVKENQFRSLPSVPLAHMYHRLKIIKYVVRSQKFLLAARSDYSELCLFVFAQLTVITLLSACLFNLCAYYSSSRVATSATPDKRDKLQRAERFYLL